MTRIYTPRLGYCFVKQHKENPSGLYIVGQDSMIYEIVKLPNEVAPEYQEFQVGTKIIIKNGWRGIKAYEEKGETIYVMDFSSIVAIIE